MMTLYVSPYRRMSRMREAMERLLDESFPSTESVEREILLAVDVKGDDEAYDITAFIPGVEAEDINVEVLNNTVTIRGEFRDTHEEGDKYLMCELPTGHFSRVITLPTALDPSKATANLKDGIFTLRLPKAEAHRPKTIKIAAG